jgi:hypothetical protein
VSEEETENRVGIEFGARGINKEREIHSHT